MKLERSLVTPYTTFLFLIVALSGVLMFFHVLDDYTKVLHELLGLGFVVFSAFHVALNWASLKSHFKKKVFAVAAIVVLLLSVVLVVSGKSHKDHEPHGHRERGARNGSSRR